MIVYIAPEVADILSLHSYLQDDSFRALSIRQQLEKQAGVIQSAHEAADRRVLMHLMSWWPAARGRSPDEVMQLPFNSDDARLVVAREYGFGDWSEVAKLADKTPDNQFETALDEILSGDFRAISSRLDRAPELARQRSAFGHRATLLHYLGANGVESHRQRMPTNAPDLARLLIDHGADIAATADMYGGGQTPYMLSASSAHPISAGIAEELNRVLAGK